MDTAETIGEHPILLKYKEGDNKDLGFWFIVTGSWLKEKNQKQQTRDRKPNLYSNRAKGDVIQESLSGTEIKPIEPDTVNAVVGNSEDMIPEGNFPSYILSEVFPRQ